MRSIKTESLITTKNAFKFSRQFSRTSHQTCPRPLTALAVRELERKLDQNADKQMNTHKKSILKSFLSSVAKM